MAYTPAESLTIEDFVKERRYEIDNWLEQRLSERSDRAILKRVLEGGKRLRPILVLLIFEAAGGKDRESALDVAIALELAHNASLIHDDVIDWDEYRRGKPSLWKQVGIGRTVIEGHRIINLAFKIILEKGVETTKVFLEAWDRTSFGVLEEFLTSTSPTKTFYLRIAQEKTGHLFAAGAEVASIVANAGKHFREKAKKYGLLVGTAYQLADDYVEVAKRGAFIRMFLEFQRLEDMVRRGYLAIKTGKFSTFVSNVSKLRTIEPFIGEMLRETLMDIDKTVDEMNVEPGYNRLLKEYPRYCIKEMLKGQPHPSKTIGISQPEGREGQAC